MKTAPTYYELVYTVVKQIPEGCVTNYGAIADYLALGSSRMVGWALNNCVKGDGIPAHRVVNRKGELSGRHHFDPPSSMEKRLVAEGIAIENDTIIDFERHFWSPLQALGLDFELY